MDDDDEGRVERRGTRRAKNTKKKKKKKKKKRSRRKSVEWREGVWWVWHVDGGRSVESASQEKKETAAPALFLMGR